MSVHFIHGGILMILGLTLLWLWTIPRFRNRVWLEGLMLGASGGCFYAGAEVMFPWFQQHANSLSGIVIATVGFGLFFFGIRTAADYFEKRSKPS